MIEKSVMKVYEYKGAVCFRVACDCSDSDHDMTIEFEKDEELPEMYFINFHKKMEWSCYWGNYNWFDRQWRKIKAIANIIFKGYIEVQESFILRGEDHIDSFIKALKEGKNHMK